MTTPVAVPVDPEATPAWWLHWCNLAIAAVSFVGVAVHPGWHPPPILVEIVAPLAIVLAVGSGIVFAVLHHQVGEPSRTSAAVAYLRAHEGDAVTVAADVAPLVAADPALEGRLAALEAVPVPAVLSPGILSILHALEGAQAAPTPPVPAVAAPTAPGVV